jgi:hypothetical protein
MAKKSNRKKVSASSDSQPAKATRREEKKKNNSFSNKSKDAHPELQTNYMKNSIMRSKILIFKKISVVLLWSILREVS